jgi:DNA repair exonuclease SbcCD ATPase subunit
MTSIPNDQVQYVTLEQFQKLQGKLKKKEDEIKKYKELLQGYSDNINSLEDNLRSSKLMFTKMSQLYEDIRGEIHEKNKTINEKECHNCKELQSQLLSIQSKEKESNNNIDFTTVSKSVNNMKEIYLKKFEELEQSYKEVLKNFNAMCSKFSVLKEENLLLKEENDKNHEKMNKLSNRLTKKTDELLSASNDVKKLKNLIERFREVDKCLLENSMRTYFMNTKISNSETTKELSTTSIVTNPLLNQGKGIENASYIMCEPLPSIVKFIANSKSGQSSA